MYYYIIGMSENRKDIHRELANKSGQLTDHLIKIFLFESSNNINHWIDEVYSFVNRCPKFAHNNKYPDKRFISKALNIYLDNLPNICESIQKDYPNYIVKRSYEEVSIMINEYIDWLACQLSTKGVVARTDVVSKLSEMITK